MTLFEICRYIPIGSVVTFFGWDEQHSKPDPQMQNRGTLVALKYGSEGVDHSAVLLQAGQEKSYPVGQVAHIRIEKLPDDYDIGKDEITVDKAAWAMFGTVRDYMKYITPAKRQELDLVFQTEFPDETANLCSVLNRKGLFRESELIVNWRQCSYDQWQWIFQNLYEARLEAEQYSDPDVSWLRRAEAYFCCRARKENRFIYDMEQVDPIAYAISLIVRNLAGNQMRMRGEEEFGSGEVCTSGALDWMLLASCYHRSGMHSTCAYVALFQSLLNLGHFFTDRKNIQLFLQLCGNAHDFTGMKYLLEYGRTAEQGQSSMELTAIGKCVCWMLYQMGGSGILDAADLLSSVQGCTDQSLPQLRERALAYVHKYIPRNRNDRYMAITYAMGLLLEARKREHPDAECRFGYLYEFHGGREMSVGYYDGFILGEDFLCYRISYPADSYHRLPMMIQAKSARSRESGERAVFGVWFYPSTSGMLYRYQAESDIEFENGGMFDL